MAKGKKTGGRDFQPGHKFGKGGASHNPALKKIRRLTHEEIAEIGSLILEGNRARLLEVKLDPESSVLKVWFVEIALKALEKGDPSALNVILDRIVGKVTERVELTEKERELKDISDEELDAMLESQ